MIRLGLAAAHLAAGRYEESIKWADRALGAQPDYRPALWVKVVSWAQLGRIEEARDWLSRMFELEPGLTIASYKAAVKHHPPELLARCVEDLRKAGLREE